MNTANTSIPSAQPAQATTPSASAFAGSEQNRQATQDSLKRMNKTLAELAENADKTSPQNVGILKNLMRAILNFLSRIAAKLGMKKAADNYQAMSNQVNEAQTGREVGDVAREAQTQTQDAAAQLGLVSDEQMTASAQALQKGGISKFDAAAWALMAANRGENIGDPSKIVPAALNGHADAIESLRQDLAAVEQKIRAAVSQAAAGQSPRIDISATSIKDLKRISESLDMEPAERAGLGQLFQEFADTNKHVEAVKMDAHKMLEIGWKSGMAMADIHVPINRIWGVDELQQILKKFEGTYPEEAKSRETAERKAVLAAQSKQVGDLAPDAPVERMTGPMPSQVAKLVGANVEAVDADMALKTAQTFLQEAPAPVAAPSPELSPEAAERAASFRFLQNYRMRASGAASLQALAAADAVAKVTQQTPQMLEAQASLQESDAARAAQKAVALVQHAARDGDPSVAGVSIQDRLLAASAGASRSVDLLAQIDEAQQRGDPEQNERAPVPSMV